jgi:hypothetical protein
MATSREAPESIAEFRQRFYVAPRAFPDTVVDPQLHLRSWKWFGLLHDSLHIPYLPPPFALPGTAPALGAPEPCRWSSIGPTNVNGRVTGIAIDPTNAAHVLVSTVGGVWRSRDTGKSWVRVSDQAPPLGPLIEAGVFGAVAINPVAPAEVFMGGGDPQSLTTASGGGPGLWRSTSDGDPGSWLPEANLTNEVIVRIRIGPASHNDVYVATSDGVWLGTRQTAGNLTWARLGTRTFTCTDLVVDFDPPIPVVTVGVVGSATERGIWRYAGGAWSRVWDGKGTTCVSCSGAIGLAMFAGGHDRMYAKIANALTGGLCGIYKSVNGGRTWSRIATSAAVDDSYPYSWFNSAIEIDPTNSDIVVVGGLVPYWTHTGGLPPLAATPPWESLAQGLDHANYPETIHKDQHVIAFDNQSPPNLWVGNDGGLDYAENTTSNSWHWEHRSHGIRTAEFYDVSTVHLAPTAVAAGSQDNGTEVTFGNRSWYAMPRCDASSVALDAPVSSALYQGCFDPYGAEQVIVISNPVPGTQGGQHAIALPAASETPFPPVAADPELPGAAIAARVTPPALVKTTDGTTWSLASPFLPAKAYITSVAVAARCLAPPSTHFCTYYVGYADTAPPLRTGIWVTHSGGGQSPIQWNTLSPGLPTPLIANGIAVDRNDPAHAFAAFGGTLNGIELGQVFVTTNGGSSWAPLTAGGSTTLVAPALDVVIDPVNANRIYVATTGGVLRGDITVGLSTAVTWTPFDAGMPSGAEVTRLTVIDDSRFLIAATKGYGAFEIDLDPAHMCPQVLLSIRDNVFDRGTGPAPFDVSDPEHPVQDPSRPEFYRRNPDAVGRLYWWTSADIRVTVPTRTPIRNKVAIVDPVAMETCPVEAGKCPAVLTTPCPDCPSGAILDQDPHAGEDARVYVQVTNRGTHTASNLRVIALWADASLRLPALPSNFWTTLFPATGMGCGPWPTSSEWKSFNQLCQPVPSLAPGEAAVMEFDWSPVPTTAAEHTCVMAMVESPDDPIPATTRVQLVPDMFIADTHQIGLRNLHVVDGVANTMIIGAESLKLTNGTQDTTRFNLVISRSGLPVSANLDVSLPPTVHARSLTGITRAAAGFDSLQHERISALPVEQDSVFVITGSDAILGGLFVPPDSTLTLAVSYRVAPSNRPDAPRFTIVAKQGKRIVGGSTWVIRRR